MSAEVLSPCGSFEALVAAVRTGCDAVYAGSKLFSARQGADNFTEEELSEAVRLCHKSGIKFYQAINTVVTDSELPLLACELEKACKIGVDGIIVQDLAVVSIVKEACPDLEIHASTQMTLHTPAGVDFAKKLGFSRAVAARELSKDEIASLCGRGIEIEAFVHGALCMCVSGQCYMSAMIGSRSANRGRCAQACRLPFSNGIPTAKGGNDYALSLKDMSIIPYLKELEETGVSSLKIEGRMKRPEYVAAATDACRKSLDGEPFDTEALKSVFSRSGFTDGYYTGKRREMFGTRRKEDVVSAAEVLKPLKQLYRKERKAAKASFALKAVFGERIRLEISDGSCTAAVFGNEPQEAVNTPLTQEFCERQLSKLGDTIYEFGGLECEIGEGVAVSAGELNALRREACLKLDEARIEKNTFRPQFNGESLFFDFPKFRNIKLRQLRIDVTKAEQLRMIDFDNIEMAIVPIEEISRCEGFDKSRIAISLPRFITDEAALEKRLEEAFGQGFKMAYVSNYAHIELCGKIGFELHGDFGLNITNSLALRELSKLKIISATLSPELKASQIAAIGDFARLGVIGYGRLPLMMTRNCPIGDCSRCKGFITDRTKRNFPIKCEKRRGYTEVLNSDVLWLGDKLSELNADFVTLKFYDETTEQAAKITEMFLKGEKTEGKFTRGLYFRGII